MGKSYERDGFFGKYTEHYDDNGNKIGESREKEGFFGNYTEHTDVDGNKIGESCDREGFFSDYTEHTDTSGNKIGESREREGFFGDYMEHTDTSGKKTGESLQRDGLFGKYTENTGTGWFGGHKQEDKAQTPSSCSPHYSSSSSHLSTLDRSVHARTIIVVLALLFAASLLWSKTRNEFWLGTILPLITGEIVIHYTTSLTPTTLRIPTATDGAYTVRVETPGGANYAVNCGYRVNRGGTVLGFVEADRSIRTNSGEVRVNGSANGEFAYVSDGIVTVAISWPYSGCAMVSPAHPTIVLTPRR